MTQSSVAQVLDVPNRLPACILTVLDWPNDPLTFIGDNVAGMSSSASPADINPTSADIASYLSGKDTCGDIQYPVSDAPDGFPRMDIRYFDDVSFVVRYYTEHRSYRQITGTVQVVY